jgi:hypothetical protein
MRWYLANKSNRLSWSFAVIESCWIRIWQTSYGVTTKSLNEQVRRNRNRFPIDFLFQLTSREKAEVVANCDYLKHLKFSSVRPLAFSEHGAVMVASVLNSKRAIEVSIYVVRAFVALRKMLGAHRE